MKIALFDLDHTLIPFDSGSLFTRHLASLGVLQPGFEAQYLDHCRRYAEGSVDMAQMHRFTVGALSSHPPERLADWLRQLQPKIAAQVPPASLQLVRSHGASGHRCVLVTATTRFIAETFARVLGLAEVLATQPAVDGQGRYTGEIVGPACFQGFKVHHVEGWLAGQGRVWQDVERSWFYSDSIHDLPLLRKVSDPVAVDPDPALRQEALRAGWPVISLRGDGP